VGVERRIATSAARLLPGQPSAMSHQIPWDGREPITDAMVRYGLRDDFQAAVDRGDREESMRILRDIGADDQTAWEMVAVLIRTEGGPASA
jgi:hypothetical protein